MNLEGHFRVVGVASATPEADIREAAIGAPGPSVGTSSDDFGGLSGATADDGELAGCASVPVAGSPFEGTPVQVEHVVAAAAARVGSRGDEVSALAHGEDGWIVDRAV